MLSHSRDSALTRRILAICDGPIISAEMGSEGSLQPKSFSSRDLANILPVPLRKKGASDKEAIGTKQTKDSQYFMSKEANSP